VETEEEVFALPKTSLQTKTPQDKSSKASTYKKAYFASVAKKGIAEQEIQEAPKTTTVIVTFNIQIGKREAPLKQFKTLIGLALATIKENLDEHARFVPIKDEVKGQIKSLQDIPKLILGFPKKNPHPQHQSRQQHSAKQPHHQRFG